MLVQLGAPPLAGFDRPLAMMADCHRRIEHFLGVLQRIEREFGARELSPNARQGLVASLEYFQHSAPRHTADEEESLFPRLREGCRGAIADLRDLAGLEEDHRRMEAGHDEVHRLVGRWLATGWLRATERARLRSALNELAAAYAAHIRLEEDRLFVLASQTLSASDLAAIGREMRQRRDLDRRLTASDDL